MSIMNKEQIGLIRSQNEYNEVRPNDIEYLIDSHEELRAERDALRDTIDTLTSGEQGCVDHAILKAAKIKRGR